MTDETPTPQPAVPTDPTQKFGNPALTEYLPDALEDVHEYSGMVHPFPNNTGNANVSE